MKDSMYGVAHTTIALFAFFSCYQHCDTDFHNHQFFLSYQLKKTYQPHGSTKNNSHFCS
jgi:hypothetical protein